MRGSTTAHEPHSLRPAYIAGRGERTWTARFSSGKSLEVSATRARNYPGLAGQAPRTLHFYQALLELDRTLSVVDVGSGAGEGCATLARHFDKLKGLDADDGALAFAREYVPGVEFLRADVQSEWPLQAVDLVSFVDVLSHLEHPELALLQVRRHLAPGGRVWLAEPHSALGQRLRAPQRRGYTRAELEALLTRTGFRVQHWVCEDETFVAVMAEVATGNLAECLALATEAVELGAIAEAWPLLERCIEASDTPHAHEARLQLAALLLRQNRGEQAAALLVGARQSNPRDARAWTGLGRIALQTADFDTAIQCAVEALECEPCDAAGSRLLAEALQAVNHPQTLQAWATAARAAPSDLDVASRLARCFAAQGDYQAGINALTRVREYRQQVDANFHVVLGWLHLLDDKHPEALRQARSAWLLEPGGSAALELWHALDECGASRRIEA
jgi:tetratricopeptide (TPR) repeat protein